MWILRAELWNPGRTEITHTHHSFSSQLLFPKYVSITNCFTTFFIVPLYADLVAYFDNLFFFSFISFFLIEKHIIFMAWDKHVPTTVCIY